MSLPIPQPGLVISYSYLWNREAQAGEVDGRKDRPCAIVAVVSDENNDKVVVVLPITHSEPNDPKTAVEIPLKVNQRLGLDSDRSWIICSEINQFIWPGPDLRRIHAIDDRFDYGFIPPALLKQVQTKIQLLARGRQLKLLKRTE